MSIDKKFEVPKPAREIFIKQNIADKLPEEQRKSASSRANKIADNYVGRDLDALSVMGYAAEQGKFEDFAARLEKQLTENLQYTHPEARQNQHVPSAARADRFFLACYTELGVQRKYV